MESETIVSRSETLVLDSETVVSDFECSKFKSRVLSDERSRLELLVLDDHVSSVGSSSRGPTHQACVLTSSWRSGDAHQLYP